jgi:RHS repeat-associated protein
MNWNTPEADQRRTYAAAGENPPIALSAETFFDDIQIGECSSLLSYEISSEDAIVFAHIASSTLSVEAVKTDGTAIFSNSVSCPGSFLSLITRCPINDWLIVNVSSVLYIFESLTGDFIGSLSLPAQEIYETPTGEVVARTSYFSSPFTRMESITYDSVLDVLNSSFLWSPDGRVGGYYPSTNSIALGVDSTTGPGIPLTTTVKVADLQTGTEQWSKTFSDSREGTPRGFDSSGNLYFSYLKNGISMLEKLSGGTTVWDIDLTDYETPHVGLFTIGSGLDLLQVSCEGAYGGPTPWASRPSEPPPAIGSPEGGSADWIDSGESSIDLAHLTICEDAIYVLHSAVAPAGCGDFTFYPKMYVLNPSTGAVKKSKVFKESGTPQNSQVFFSANYSSGSWSIVNTGTTDGEELSIVGLGIDGVSINKTDSGVANSTLPFGDDFIRGCIVDGKFYYPYFDAGLSEVRINILGDAYVDDRDERNCLETDCCNSCTTFGEYVKCINDLVFKSCRFDAAPASLGYGWSLPVYKYLEESSNGDLVYHDGTGMFERWVRDEDDNFFPAHPDNYIKATLNQDDSYSLTHPDGSVMNFDATTLRISTWEDTNDNVTTYEYETTGDKRLIRIDDGEGRETNIGYGARTDGQPVTLTSHTPSVGTARVTQLDYYGSGHANEDRLWKTTNPENEVTEFLYFPDGRMKQIKDARGEVAEEYTYYTDGRLESITRYGVAKESFTFDDVNNSYTQEIEDLTDVSTPTREIIRFFDEHRNITEVRQRVNATDWNITLRFFESPHNPYLLTREIAPNGAETKYQYTERGNVREIEDPQGNKTNITYMHEEDPSHAVPDLVTTVRRPVLNDIRTRTAFDYDAKGNLTKTIDALGNEVNYTYLADGRVWKIENELEDVTVFTYQGTPHDGSFRHLQRVEIPTDTGTRDITYVFDDFDNVLEIENELMEKIVYTYDDLNRVLTVKDPEQAVTTFHYQDGLMDYTLLPPNQASGSSNARQVTMMHDDVGRVVQSKMATGLSTELVRASYDYTGFSELKTLTRPKGASDPEFNFQYDRLGRPTVMTDPLSESSSTAYEPYCVGRAVTSARGVRTKMEFDTRCQLTTVTTGDQGATPLDVSNPRITRTFTYDELGRMTGSTQSPNDIASRPLYGRAKFGESRYGQTALVPNDGERTYEYDELDRLIRMVFEDGSDVHYEYDEASRLTKKTDIDDKVTEYGYRKDHLLKTLTVKRESQSDRVFTYSYDEAGRVTQVQYPGESQLIAYIDNGTPGTGWDRNGRLKHLRYELNGSPLRSFAYDYDESGNRTQATEVAGSTTTVYKYYYDWLDRLLRVEKGPNTSSLSPVSIYTYDESDNPTKLELPEAFLEYDFTFDLASNIETRKETDTTVSSAPVVNFTENFTPDEDGNVLTRTRTVGADTHQITYEWDDFNKLVAVSASLNGSPAAEPKQSNAYAVNGFRRQKTKKDGEIVTEYAEGLATAVAKAQAETITYIHGHQILGFEQGGQFYYFLTDALGSVRDIVDGNGQVVQQYQYDERGNHVIAPMSGGPASPKTFVGGLSVNDDTSDGGLYLMGHRFYDPSLGRFLNRDPIGFAGGLNLFSYGGNNPVTHTDPTGLFTGPDDVLVMAGEIVWDAFIASLTAARDTPAPPQGKVVAGLTVGATAVAYPLALAATSPGSRPMASPMHDLKWGLVSPDQVGASSYGKSVSSSKTEPEEPCPKSLYHYTSKEGYDGIMGSGAIKPSTDPKYARYGSGQYFTNISPEMIGVSLTINQAMRSLFGIPWGRENRMTHYLEVEVTGLQITNPRSGTYLHPSEVPLLITDRLVRGGAR